MPGRLFPKPHEGAAPQEFGQGAHILKTRTFNLTVARDLEEIAVGGSCLWAVNATSLTAYIDVCINDQLRDPVRFQQGMFIRGIPFSRLFVSHPAQVGATITLFFAVEVDPRNIQVVNPSTQFNNVNIGTIAQDDSWFYDSIHEQAYMGSAYKAGTLGENSMCQLWNPAASGKNLYCSQLLMMTDATAFTFLEMGHHNAALLVDEIEGNKWLNAAAGVGLLKRGSDVGVLGTTIAQFAVQPNIVIPIPLPHPVIIEPGIGFVVGLSEIDKILHVLFQWIERDV